MIREDLSALVVSLIKTGVIVNLKELNIAAGLPAMAKNHHKTVCVPIAPTVKLSI
jgi:hypothetical protein